MRKLIKYLYVIVHISFAPELLSFTIHHAMLSSDANPSYLDFWPIMSKVWSKKIGIRPVLALIATSDVVVSQKYGDVIRFDPIPGIPAGFQAQVIRLLCPALFPDKVFIISDIDLLPMSKKYFKNSVAHVHDNCFVVYRDGEWASNPTAIQFPMCYCAAQGSVFGEIFGVHTLEDIKRTIIEWHNLGLEWFTDQIVLFKYVTQWSDYHTRCIKLGYRVEKRIDRDGWYYDQKLVRKNYYIDAHLLRPYSQHKYEIDKLVNLMLVKKKKR